MSRESTTRTRDSNETLIIEKRNHVGRVVLNRPHALNAVDAKMGRELAQALQDIETDQGIRCLVITGAGRAFCAGEDVPSFKARNFASLGRLLGRSIIRSYGEYEQWKTRHCRSKRDRFSRIAIGLNPRAEPIGFFTESTCPRHGQHRDRSK